MQVSFKMTVLIRQIAHKNNRDKKVPPYPSYPVQKVQPRGIHSMFCFGRKIDNDPIHPLSEQDLIGGRSRLTIKDPRIRTSLFYKTLIEADILLICREQKDKHLSVSTGASPNSLFVEMNNKKPYMKYPIFEKSLHKAGFFTLFSGFSTRIRLWIRLGVRFRIRLGVRFRIRLRIWIGLFSSTGKGG